jgi:hypothetical protein
VELEGLLSWAGLDSFRILAFIFASLWLWFSRVFVCFLCSGFVLSSGSASEG